MKGSQLEKKAYAMSKYDTELLTYCQSSVTAFSVFILLLPFPPSVSPCVLTHDDLRTLVSQNLHVESFLFFPSSVSWPSKRNVQAPMFQTQRRAPVSESPSDFSNHTHWSSKRCCFLLKTSSPQIFKERVRSRKCSIFTPFLVLFWQFSAINISIWQNGIYMYSQQLCSCF